MAADNWAVEDTFNAGYWVNTFTAPSTFTTTNNPNIVPYRTKLDCASIRNTLNDLPGNTNRFHVGTHPKPH